MALGDNRYARPEYYLPLSKNSLLIFSEDYIVDHFLIATDFAVSPHKAVCQLNNECKHHVLLFCNVRSQQQLLDELKEYQFRYIEVDDLYSYYRFLIHGEEIKIHGGIITKLKDGVDWAQLHPSILKQPSVLQKKVARKRVKLHTRADNNNRKSSSTQTIEQSFNKRIQSVMEGPYAMEFARILDCLYDRHGEVKTHKLEFFIKK